MTSIVISILKRIMQGANVGIYYFQCSEIFQRADVLSTSLVDTEGY